jgi:hypothetical protein
MLPAPAAVRVPPPVPAIAASVLAVLSGIVPGLLVLILLALQEGRGGVWTWLWILVSAGLFLGLVVGAGLLLLGRSWLALVVPAGSVAALVLVERVVEGGGGRLFGILALVVPLTAAVLGALPTVRGWVRDRRAA